MKTTMDHWKAAWTPAPPGSASQGAASRNRQSVSGGKATRNAT